MEGKDVDKIGSSVLLDSSRSASGESPSKLQPGTSLSSIKSTLVEALSAQAVSVDVHSAAADTDGSKDLRGKANQAIDAINVAADAANEIEKLVRGIDGIVGQAQQLLKGQSGEGNTNTHRVPLLEQEANQLLTEIKKLALSQAPNGSRPLAGDKISLDAENKGGKAVDVTLPQEAAQAFGIDKLSLSSVDAIVDAKSNVDGARDRIQKIRNSISETHKEVTAIVNQLEVAFQNSEASRVSIRDVDEALKVVDETSRKISGNPDGALKAIKLSKGALTLLEG